MTVDVALGDSAMIGRPYEVADLSGSFIDWSDSYAVMSNGETFVFTQQPEPEPITHINVILDFASELEQLLPSGG